MEKCHQCGKAVLYGQPTCTLHNFIFHLACLVLYCQVNRGTHVKTT
jgi:hypothetical protein